MNKYEIESSSLQTKLYPAEFIEVGLLTLNEKQAQSAGSELPKKKIQICVARQNFGLGNSIDCTHVRSLPSSYSSSLRSYSRAEEEEKQDNISYVEGRKMSSMEKESRKCSLWLHRLPFSFPLAVT